jgi:DNA cross-link repair 1A protein
LLERDDEKQTTTTLSSYSLDIHNDGTILSQAEEPIMDEKTKVQQATGLKSEQEDNFDEEEEGDNASEAADDLNCTQIVLLSSDSEEDDDDDDDQPLAKLVESANNTHRATSNVPDTDAAKVQAFVDNEKEDDDVVVVINDDDDDDQEDNTFDDPLVMDLASSNDKNNNELLSCNICGISLAHIQSGWNGRLNHIKRCAKKHHYTAKDTRFNDDYELFAPPMTKSAAATATTSNNQTVNPYTKPSDWHGRDDDAKLAQAQLSKQAAPSAFSTLMAGARRAAKLQKIQAQSPQAKRGRDWKQGGGGRGYQNRQDGSERPCPFYKKIPNTDFVVDGFHYAKASLTSNYFLSHFHSDHYGGITKAWDAGIIYCSIGTANLVHQQLGVDRKFLHPLPMNTPTLIASQNNKPIEVTLLDANHCPGAVMFLFMVGKRKILHVGDFRWNRQVMLTLAPLTPFFCGDDRIDDLFLDTTYCDAKYDLPSQQETIEAAIKVAVEEMEKAQSNKKKLLMLFGAYTIGT